MMLAIYLAVAALLGVVWFGALLIPSNTRLLLLDTDWWNLSTNPRLLVSIMVITSTAVAFLFRGPVTRATGRRHVVLAVTLPFLGASIFWALLIAVAGISGHREAHGVISASVLFVSVLPSVWLNAAMAAYVVVPLGFLSQFVMHLVGVRTSIKSAG
jgi:hypothetical protein